MNWLVPPILPYIWYDTRLTPRWNPATILPMYVERVPNRNSPPAILIRQSRWHRGKVLKSTLANISKLPAPLVDQIALLLKGGVVVGPASDSFQILESRPAGHVAAALGLARRLGLPNLLHSRRSTLRDRALALLVLRLLEPGSRLEAAGLLQRGAAMGELNRQLALGDISANHLYAALDWLDQRAEAVSDKLARRHLAAGGLALYDLTSAWYTGYKCPLAARGHSRDGKRGSLQINVGLLCDSLGRPVSASVYPGNTADPSTVADQCDALRRRFGLASVVLVGDRGMLTGQRIREDLAPREGFGWITSLRAPTLRALVQRGELKPAQVGPWQLRRLQAKAYPGERVIACRNPSLQVLRTQRRQDLLDATEAELREVLAAVQRQHEPLRGDALTIRVHEALKRRRMKKHFAVEIGEDTLSWQRRTAAIAAEQALDGLWAVRAKVPEEQLSDEGVVRAYKRLARVERAFRHMKTADLQLRPFYVRKQERVRGHVMTCLLAYYLEWHMRRRLASLLYDEEEPERAVEGSPVMGSGHGEATVAKRKKRRTADGEWLWNFRSLLGEMRSLTRNRVRFNLPGGAEQPEVWMHAAPSPLQQRVLDLLRVRLKP